MFDALGPLGGLNGFSPGDDDKVQVVIDKVEGIDSALGGDKLLDRIYTCGAAGCDPDSNKVKDITAIELRLAIGGSKNGDIDFSSLNLPSLGFLPKNAQKLHVDLSWSTNVRLIADANGLHLAPVDNAHELTLGATITLPTSDFTIDLGALVVKATTDTKPQFKGSLLVDVGDDGGLSFGFGDDSGFKARWHLQTDKSPFMGVQGDLDINWPLAGGGVNASALTIKFENLSIETAEFLGKDIQDAAKAIRDVTHPIRTVTSPLFEPIPGLSDLSAVLGGDDVTILRLMERAGFSPQVRDLLEKLRALDDAVSALAGSGDGSGGCSTCVSLGSFTLVGRDALTPVDQPFSDAAKQKLQETLQNIVDKCSACKESVNKLLTAVNGGATPGQGGFKFDLPVLREPATLAGMLLGRNVDLITFDTGRLGPSERLDIPLFRFLIFAVGLDGPGIEPDPSKNLVASIDLKGGVDTQGISDAIKSGDGADVLNGVYLQTAE